MDARMAKYTRTTVTMKGVEDLHLIPNFTFMLPPSPEFKNAE